MNETQVLRALNAALAKMVTDGLLPREAATLNAHGAMPIADLGLDSVNKMNLLLEIEMQLERPLPVTVLQAGRTVGEVARAIAAALGESEAA